MDESKTRRIVAAALLADDDTWKALSEALKWLGWAQPPLGQERGWPAEMRTVRELTAMRDQISNAFDIDFETYT